MTKFASFLTLVVALVSTFTMSPVSATTWHVPGDASTIKAGINLASAGDTVLVACGNGDGTDLPILLAGEEPSRQCPRCGHR